MTTAKMQPSSQHALLLKISLVQKEIEQPKKVRENPGFKGVILKYAGLSDTMEVLEPVMEKHNLGHLVFFEGRNLTYRVFDKDTGAFLDSAMELPLDSLTGNVWQQLGQAFTYLRRYLAQAFWQIIPEDDDAQSAPQRSRPAAARTGASQKASEGTAAEDELL